MLSHPPSRIMTKMMARLPHPAREHVTSRCNWTTLNLKRISMVASNNFSCKTTATWWHNKSSMPKMILMIATNNLHQLTNYSSSRSSRQIKGIRATSLHQPSPNNSSSSSSLRPCAYLMSEPYERKTMRGAARAVTTTATSTTIMAFNSSSITVMVLQLWARK